MSAISSLSLWITLLLGARSAAALHSLDINCTIPDTAGEFYYVSTPNVRGSLDIVWSCLTTLILCTYSAVFLPVPKQHLDKNPSRWIRVKRSTVWSSIGIAILVTLAPEFLFCKSVFELIEVRRKLQEVRRAAGDDAADSWTLSHMWLAKMGGYAVEYNATSSQTTSQAVGEHTLASDRADSSKDLQKVEEAVVRQAQASPRDRQLVQLNAGMLVEAMRQGLLPGHAPDTKEQIMDKSKADLLAKSLAVIQIISFTTTFFARVAQGLAITQLELATLAVAACSVFVYACLWAKPKGVTTTTSIRTFTGALPSELAAIIRGMQATRFFDQPRPEEFDTTPSALHIVSDDQPHDNTSGPILIASLHCSAVPLGAVHLAGWNLTYPSPFDQWLWRAAAIAVTAAGPLILAVAVAALGPLLLAKVHVLTDPIDPSTFMRRVVNVIQDQVYLIMIPMGHLVYLLARAILLIEMVRCLFYLPPAAFLTPSWAASFPQFG